MAPKVLIVDDEPVQLRLLSGLLEKLGYTPVVASDGEKALEVLSGSSGSAIKAVLLDMVMPEMGGLEVLAEMRNQKLAHPVIVQTAQGGVETAVQAMQAGAIDFVVKPASPERLKASLANAMRFEVLQGEIKRISRKASGKLTVDEIISSSAVMERVKSIAVKAAKSGIPVLIEGESGVGKELVARAIQGMSDRASKKFVTVNCGALPENLVESILFGHEKGSFTGANDKHLGKFQEANGGTLFLDEVGELPADIQVKLLRALQEGEIDPIGSSKPVKVDVRILSATNRDLMQEVSEGNFREDLYYRLNVLPITVPPLRERMEDVPELLRHFMTRIATEEGRTNITAIAPDAQVMLTSYRWPGNIRQLENAVFRAVVLCDGDALTIDDFPQIAVDTGTPITPIPVSPAPTLETPIAAESHGMAENQPNGLPVDALKLVGSAGDVITLEQAEREIIAFAIETYNGKMAKVARKLGIGRSTLYRKLREYGLDHAVTEDPAI